MTKVSLAEKGRNKTRWEHGCVVAGAGGGGRGMPGPPSAAGPAAKARDLAGGDELEHLAQDFNGTALMLDQEAK